MTNSSVIRPSLELVEMVFDHVYFVFPSFHNWSVRCHSLYTRSGYSLSWMLINILSLFIPPLSLHTIPLTKTKLEVLASSSIKSEQIVYDQFLQIFLMFILCKIYLNCFFRVTVSTAGMRILDAQFYWFWLLFAKFKLKNLVVGSSLLSVFRKPLMLFENIRTG